MKSRADIVAVALGLLSGRACGVSDQKTLRVQPPVAEARVGLGRKIRVTLEPGAQLPAVADPSVFAPFQAGMTHEEAVAVTGQPTGTWTDGYGQLWYRYDRPRGTIKIGCECFSSGNSVSSNCTWQLYAIRRDTAPDAGLVPQLVSFVESAKAVPEQVDYRTLVVTTADYSESISWPLQSQDSVLTIA